VSNDHHRNRSVQKIIRFTPEEWQQASAILDQVREYRPMSLNEFVCQSVLGKQITVIAVPLDYTKMEVQVNKIGVNVNQIAHRVNAQDYATLEEVNQVKAELAEVHRLVGEAWKTFREQQGR
jgi:hypothetical protein